MTRIEKIMSQIEQLVIDGISLRVDDTKDITLTALLLKYEAWYTRSFEVIKQIIPDRLGDFREAYKLDKRKEIAYDTYTISDYLMGLSLTRNGKPVFKHEFAYNNKLERQIALLVSAKQMASSVLYNIRTELRAELLDGDLEAAKSLLKANQIRSAGVICGVVLETHLKTVFTHHALKSTKKKLVLSDLNDALKEAGIYDIPMWRFIQHLADIRNLCAHSGDREPKLDEVRDLISGSEKVVKEVF